MTVERDVDKAKELFEYTCEELNFSESCLALGNIYLAHESKEPVADISWLAVVQFGPLSVTQH